MICIHFTEGQKCRASCVDLVEFLRRQDEKLIRSGLEYRMAGDHSVTVWGNEWYDHAAEEGGGPISFVQNYCGLSYPEAVTRLLEGEQGQIYEPVPQKREESKKEFIQPSVNREVRRVYAYPLEKRLIDREVLSTFAWAGLIYGDEKYHNAVFAGKDEHGVVRHAHKRSTNDIGRTFRINVGGSDPRCSFRWNGTSDRLYVLETPIDLLSFLALYPKDWQRHNYVALRDVGEQTILWMLEQTSEFRCLILYLDHGAADIEATDRLKEVLVERGYAETTVLQSIHKGWNEDVKTRYGLEAQSMEERPQLIAAPEVCRRVYAMSITVKLDRLNVEIPWLIEQYHTRLHWGQFGQAMDCMEQVSALAVAACRREPRQLGVAATEDKLTKLLCERTHPHRNRGSLRKRHRELVPQFQSVFVLGDAVGLRAQEEKKIPAGRWLELAAAFTGIPIQYEAEQIKQREAQPILNAELGVILWQRQSCPL